MSKDFRFKINLFKLNSLNYFMIDLLVWEFLEKEISKFSDFCFLNVNILRFLPSPITVN